MLTYIILFIIKVPLFFVIDIKEKFTLILGKTIKNKRKKKFISRLNFIMQNPSYEILIRTSTCDTVNGFVIFKYMYTFILKLFNFLFKF